MENPDREVFVCQRFAEKESKKIVFFLPTYKEIILLRINNIILFNWLEFSTSMRFDLVKSYSILHKIFFPFLINRFPNHTLSNQKFDSCGFFPQLTIGSCIHNNRNSRSLLFLSLNEIWIPATVSLQIKSLPYFLWSGFSTTRNSEWYRYTFSFLEEHNEFLLHP